MVTEGRQEQLIESVKMKEMMLGLVKSPGWDTVLGILRARRKALEQLVLHQTLLDANSVYRQEFMKGQAYQILLLEQLPETLIAESLETEAVLSPEQEDQDVD